MLRLTSRFCEFLPRRMVLVRRLSSSFDGSSSKEHNGRLEGKIALITGGASGLGKATARQFIWEGATVVLADINSKLGSEAADELGSQAEFIECDVTMEEQVSDVVDFAMDRYGRLDILHNSAGIAGPPAAPDIASLDLGHFDQVMAVNVRGTLAGIKHAARVMGPMGSGSILCIASISGLLGGLGPHPYSISKFTIPGIVRSVASELCSQGIRVNCISPFVIGTPLVVEQFSQLYRGAGRERVLEIISGLGELKGANCEEIDVAKAAVYLASDDAKYVSGHNLVVDGGFTGSKRLNLPMLDQMGLV
ncbi:hypothetical protein J5N97_007102 [Dioscorea zingiberensis]|uniref:Uncharacterized protein n=1 Tax=Dioscorea zingiberensis TaxID=325984 RepID=A0A9D5DB72_9LILI|nr:hypothetical protein J5N97_007102 [Dioscorea zingiberensis]